jgi:hypothetical protein
MTIRFMDIDEAHLAILDRLARMLLSQAGLQVNVESTTDRAASLAGADYVLVSVDTARWDTWKDDYRIPRKHDRQVTGELAAWAGCSTHCSDPPPIDIGRHRVCRGRMVMVVEPLNRICLAMRRFIRSADRRLCHGVEIRLLLRSCWGYEVDDIVPIATGIALHVDPGSPLPADRGSLPGAEGSCEQRPNWTAHPQTARRLWLLPVCGGSHIGGTSLAYEF